MLNNDEMQNLKSQFVTSSWGGKRKNSTVFTEQGVAMLSAVLKSRTAIDISIKIMNAFIEMRKLIQSNSNLLIKVDKLESNQSGMSLKLIETDKRVDKIFSLMESGEIKPKQGILFDKQVFDAYKYVSDIVIDEKVIYHFGASLKDLGKKWFGFSKMEVEVVEMLSRLGMKK
jgi:hypothetical protein